MFSGHFWLFVQILLRVVLSVPGNSLGWGCPTSSSLGTQPFVSIAVFTLAATSLLILLVSMYELWFYSKEFVGLGLVQIRE